MERSPVKCGQKPVKEVIKSIYQEDIVTSKDDAELTMQRQYVED